MRQDIIGGADSTYVTFSAWNETDFRYDEFVRVAKGVDMRSQFMAMHDPPMTYVRSVRYGTQRMAQFPSGRPYGMQEPGKMAR